MRLVKNIKQIKEGVELGKQGWQPTKDHCTDRYPDTGNVCGKRIYVHRTTGERMCLAALVYRFRAHKQRIDVDE